MKDLIIFGSGGFASGDLTWLIEDINEEQAQWNLLGYLDDDQEQIGKVKNSYEVLGDASWLEAHSNIYCVLGIGGGSTRSIIVDKIKKSVAGFPNLIHPRVEMSKHIEMGIGNIILPGTLISGGTKIGNFVVLNLGCTIGHDVTLKDYVTVSPGAHLSGFVEVGTCSDIGTGACIKQLIKFGEHSFLGAGAVAVKDVPDHCTAVGIPAKVIKQNIKSL